MYITTTTDFCPKKDNKYFHNFYDTKDCISVIIPFYNEESNELYETLKSLFYTYKYLSHMKEGWEDKKLQIFLIQDGWYKSSDSMKEYLKQLFPIEIEGKNWADHYEDFKNYDFNKGPKSYIFETENEVCINLNKLPNIEIPKYLNLTLMIKIDNRKKHNSHEWFIGHNGFSEVKQSKYIFCTDAFTMFHKACLYHLVSHMEKNPKTAVCTGRQRVMSKQQQGTNELTLSLSTILRNVQLFDFESSNALYNGAFSIVGFLPVVPGPCGLYRANILLKDEVRYWYFDIVNQEPSQTGLVLGNLRIAEDRILSYSVILRGDGNNKMVFVPQSVFYFEAELDLQQFMLQRRRWINGSVAGYIYLLFTNPEHLKRWRTNIFKKTYIFLLLLFQTLTYFIVSLGPAISLDIFLHSANYLFSFSNLHYITIETVTYMVTILMCILYVMHFFIHNKNKFNNTIIYLLLLFSMTTSIIAGFALILNIFLNYELYYNMFMDSLFYKVGFGMIATVCILPFVNSILISGRCHSFYYMLKSFIPYFLFSHMLISTFGSYSYSRVWDLTWGNRPTSETNLTMTKEEMDIMQQNFKQRSAVIVTCIILLNIIIFIMPTTVKIGIVGSFFIISLFQLLMSFFYLLFNIPTKIKYVRKYMKKNISLFDLIQIQRNIVLNNDSIKHDVSVDIIEEDEHDNEIINIMNEMLEKSNTFETDSEIEKYNDSNINIIDENNVIVTNTTEQTEENINENNVSVTNTTEQTEETSEEQTKLQTKNKTSEISNINWDTYESSEITNSETYVYSPPSSSGQSIILNC